VGGHRYPPGSSLLTRLVYANHAKKDELNMPLLDPFGKTEGRRGEYQGL